MNKEKAIRFYEMIIEKNGNPSVKDFMDCGYTEGVAVEYLMRMASKNVSSAQFLESAKQLKAKYEGE